MKSRNNPFTHASGHTLRDAEALIEAGILDRTQPRENLKKCPACGDLNMNLREFCDVHWKTPVCVLDPVSQ